MAKGRPDYNVKVAPVPEVLGDDEEAYTYFGSVAVNAGANSVGYTHTVAAGDELYVVLLVVSCELPGINQFSIKIGGSFTFGTYFDTLFQYFSSGGIAFKVEAADTVEVYCHNLDAVAQTFSISVRGYVKEL